MTSEEYDRALVAAASLNEGMAQLSAAISEQGSYGRHNRRLIRWLAASVAFDIFLSVGLGLVAYQAHRQASAAVVTCRAANRIGIAQKALWAPVLAQTPQGVQTPEEQMARQTFTAALNSAAKQTDCSKL